MTRQIHQMLPTLGYGDAVGNHVLELRRLLRQAGYQSEIFAERWHPRLDGECRHYAEYRRFSNADNLLILHYSIGGEVNHFIRDLPDRVLIYYHNITPAHFFYRTNGELARLLDEGRRDLAKLAGKYPAIAVSPYNQRELETMGFQVLGLVPCIVRFDQLEATLATPDALRTKQRFAKQDNVDWLFVGRLAPNKCVDDIIKAFYYYHTWINDKSRLMLVGASDGMGPYVSSLYEWVTRLGLDGAVVFPGHVDSLGIFYEMADLYISMSEHEGFCIPLLEAMHFHIPVLAYASTAVPETLANAGVLFQRKDYALVAEMAHEMISNRELRERLIQVQRERLTAFDPDHVRAQFLSCVQGLV